MYAKFFDFWTLFPCTNWLLTYTTYSLATSLTTYTFPWSTLPLWCVHTLWMTPRWRSRKTHFHWNSDRFLLHQNFHVSFILKSAIGSSTSKCDAAYVYVHYIAKLSLNMMTPLTTFTITSWHNVISSLNRQFVPGSIIATRPLHGMPILSSVVVITSVIQVNVSFRGNSGNQFCTMVFIGWISVKEIGLCLLWWHRGWRGELQRIWRLQ